MLWELHMLCELRRDWFPSTRDEVPNYGNGGGSPQWSREEMQCAIDYLVSR